MALLYGRAGRFSTKNAGFRPHRAVALYGGGLVHDAPTAYAASLIQDVANVNYPAISSIKSTLCTGDEQVGPPPPRQERA